jgi:ferredoxin
MPSSASSHKTLRKTPRVGRRRWVKSKTFFSDAQNELTLIGGGATQLEMDLFDSFSPSSDRSPIHTQPISEPVEIEQGDLFGYLAESPEPTPQTSFEGMEKPSFDVMFSDGRHAKFQHASSLLESLEAQDLHIEFQCREGYCGSCRTRLIEGEVHYTEEPMAWIDDDEILPCCCIPKSPLRLQ